MRKRRGIAVFLIIILFLLFIALLLLLDMVFFRPETFVSDLPEPASEGKQISTFPPVDMGENNVKADEFLFKGKRIIFIGMPLRDLIEDIFIQGGSELDLSENGLDYDGWLHAFQLDDLVILCHFDKNDITDAYAVYSYDKLTSYGGMKPVAVETLAAFDSFGGSFPEYIGYWGGDFSEDEYVYFTETTQVIIFNTTEREINIVPLFKQEREETESHSEPLNTAHSLALISSTSFSAAECEALNVRCESGEAFQCDFVVWIGPYGYCFSGTGKEPIDPGSVKVFLTEIDSGIALNLLKQYL